MEIKGGKSGYKEGNSEIVEMKIKKGRNIDEKGKIKIKIK